MIEKLKYLISRFRDATSQCTKSDSNREAGFTLIELVMVIVILGILGAVAIPKFMDLSSNAETSTATGVQGALSAAAAIQYANNAVNGNAAYPNCDDLLLSTNTSGVTLVCGGTSPSFTLTGTIGSKSCVWTYNDTTGTGGGSVSDGVCT